MCCDLRLPFREDLKNPSITRFESGHCFSRIRGQSAKHWWRALADQFPGRWLLSPVERRWLNLELLVRGWNPSSSIRADSIHRCFTMIRKPMEQGENGWSIWCEIIARITTPLPALCGKSSILKLEDWWASRRSFLPARVLA
jgi:hypothetical protein